MHIDWKEKQTPVLTRYCRNGISDCVHFSQHGDTGLLRDLGLNLFTLLVTLMEQMVKKHVFPKAANLMEQRVNYLPHYVLITQMRKLLIKRKYCDYFMLYIKYVSLFFIFQRLNEKCH